MMLQDASFAMCTCHTPTTSQSYSLGFDANCIGFQWLVRINHAVATQGHAGQHPLSFRQQSASYITSAYLAPACAECRGWSQN